MEKNDINSIFEEIIEKYYWSRDYIIHEHSCATEKDWEELEKEVESYRQRIREFLK